MRRIYLLLIAGLLAVSVAAQTVVHCPEAGKLKEALAHLCIQPDTLTRLKLTGRLDARDFRTLWGGKESLVKSLQSIDLGSLTAIDAYEGTGGTDFLPITSPYEESAMYKASTIPANAFRWSSALQEVILPPFVTAISDNAFWGAEALKTIVLPESVVEIGKQAFLRCSSLEQFVLPPHLQVIGSDAFRDCVSLHSQMYLPNTVDSIEGRIFTNCNKIPKVILAKDNPYFVSDEKDAIYTADMHKLVLLPPYLKGKYVINASTREINVGCGMAIEGLTALTLPDTLNLLSAYAFAECTHLTKINLKNIKSVLSGWSAFSNCPFDSIYISSRPVTGASLLPMHFSISKPGGVNQQTCKLFVPEDSLDVFRTAFFWKDFTNIRACEKSEIRYFKIKEIVHKDEWTVDVTFELAAKNVEKYRLAQDCFDIGFGTDFYIDREANEYTVRNIEKNFTNYFNLYAINSCNEESKPSEIVLDPINTAVESTSVDSIEIKALAGSLFVTNPFDRKLSLKAYSLNGTCLLTKSLIPGNNDISFKQQNSIFIIQVEDNGKVLVIKKITTRLE